LKTLEPYAGKLSSTVPGGERRSKPPDLPDKIYDDRESIEKACRKYPKSQKAWTESPDSVGELIDFSTDLLN